MHIESVSLVLFAENWLYQSHLAPSQSVTQAAPGPLFLEEDFCMQVMIQMTHAVFDGKMSKKAAKSFLLSARENVVLLANTWGSLHGITIDPTPILQAIPISSDAVFHRLGLKPDLISCVCCRKCFALYPKDSEETRCTERFLSKYRKFEKLTKSQDQIPRCDQYLWRTNSAGQKKPGQTFNYVTLESWLKNCLLNQRFETLLDSSLAAMNRTPNQAMEDVWHGSVWQEFPNNDQGEGIFTQTSGNLVFSLYLDWFNAGGTSNLGKKNSLGAITLVCLNLPPTHRYKLENIYLFGIIPGPKEPSLEQINHLLRPLVEELQIFWTSGCFFKTTAFHPNGRTIRAAIFPLIADLPALRKAAGFGGHQATLFCSFCLLDKNNIEEIDKSKFPPRTHTEHLAHASAWLKSQSLTDRNALVKEHGARWSVLNNLTYWRPVEYCSIELMHALVLGDLMDHSMRFFSMPTVGEELKKIKEKDEAWKNDQSYTEPPYTDTYGPKPKECPNKGKGKRKRDSNTESSINTNQPNKRLRTIPTDEGTTSRTPTQKPGPSGTKWSSDSSSQPESSEVSSTSSSHSYILRDRKKSFNSMRHGSDGTSSGESDRTARGIITELVPEKEKDTDHRAIRLTPEELDVVRRTIMHTTVPSWVDRVPQNLGAANHGSLKAAEWLILYKLYYTIALIPLWTKPDNGSENEQERTRVSSLLQSTTLLSKITQFLTLPTIKSADLSELDDLLMSYRKCLQDNWPHEPSRPNLHLTQHYPEVILRFGPPRSTAAWAQERVNGILQKIPTNHHGGTCL